MRKSAIALILLAIGIVVNFLVIMGFYSVPCSTTAPAAEEGTAQPAFGAWTTCDQVHSVGFIILGLADAFAIFIIGSELVKRR